MMKCDYCDSEKVISDVQISDLAMNGSDFKMQVILQMTPDNFWNKGDRCHPVSSTICCDCGKIQLHIEDTDRLWSDYQLLKKTTSKKNYGTQNN